MLEVRAKLREESIPKCDVQATARAAGIAEQMRSYGIDRTPYFLLSRQVAGTIGQTLVCTLSGSSIGAEESLHALFPGLLHIFPMLGGGSHEKPDTAG